MEYIRGSDWGGGVGGILYTSRAGVVSWAHYNGRGDVVTRTSDTGSLTYAASYEAFGTRTQEAGTNPDRQRANTKEEDPTGLLNEGHRYRDLELGMFISRDPAGFVDGPNVYTYVVQNPWSAFDPEGLYGYETSGGLSPFDDPGAVRFSNGRVLGGGACENGLLRDAHNAAVDNKPKLLLNTVERLGSMPNPTIMLRLAEAGWASGKGDGEPLENLGIWFDAYGMAPIGEGFGTRQGAKGGEARERFSPRRTLGGTKEKGSETKPGGETPRQTSETGGEPSAPEGGSTRVGRWMSKAEQDAMQASGAVQESKLMGVTSATSPPDAAAWARQTDGSRFVEFDVPSSSIGASDGATVKIYGPSSTPGKAKGVTSMPPATNIQQTASKWPKPKKE